MLFSKRLVLVSLSAALLGTAFVACGQNPTLTREEADAIEDMYEPYLIQIGFLERTPRGRVATARAYEYFGRTMPGRGLF